MTSNQRSKMLRLLKDDAAWNRHINKYRFKRIEGKLYSWMGSYPKNAAFKWAESVRKQIGCSVRVIETPFVKAGYGLYVPTRYEKEVNDFLPRGN